MQVSPPATTTTERERLLERIAKLKQQLHRRQRPTTEQVDGTITSHDERVTNVIETLVHAVKVTSQANSKNQDITVWLGYEKSCTVSRDRGTPLTCGEVKLEAARQFNIDAYQYIMATPSSSSSHHHMSNDPPFGVVTSDSIELLPDWVALPMDVDKVMLLKKPLAAINTLPSMMTNSFVQSHHYLLPSLPPSNTKKEWNIAASLITTITHPQRYLPLVTYIISLILLIAWLFTINSTLHTSIAALERSVLNSLQVPYQSTLQQRPITVAINSNVTTMEQVWDWINGPLTNLVVTLPTDVGPPPLAWWGVTSTTTNQPWIASTQAYKILSGIRFRQMRVISQPCTLSSISTCYPAYSYSASNTTSYGLLPQSDPGDFPPGFVWKSSEAVGPNQGGAPTLAGRCASYDPSGFVVDVMNRTSFSSIVMELAEHGWIDEATRAVIVEFSVGTPLGVAASVRFLGERSTAGVVYASLTCVAFEIPTTWSCHGYTCPTPLALEICLCILCTMALIWRCVLYMSTSKQQQQHPSSWWQFADTPAFAIDFGFYICYLISLALATSAYSTVTTFELESNSHYISLDTMYGNILIATRFRAILVLAVVARIFFLIEFPLHSRVGLVHQTFWSSFVWFARLVVVLIPIVAAILLVLHAVAPPSEFVLAMFHGEVNGFMTTVSSTTGWTAVVMLFVVCVMWIFIIPALMAGVVLWFQVLSLHDSSTTTKKNAAAAAPAAFPS